MGIGSGGGLRQGLLCLHHGGRLPAPRSDKEIPPQHKLDEWFLLLADLSVAWLS